MDKHFVTHEVLETTLWLLEITGIVLLAIVGIIYHHEWAILSGGIMCVIYFAISAFRRREDRRKALTSAAIAAALAAGLIIRYTLQ